ncbi:MAG: ATP-dependent zinc metalloprotease FtsH [Mycoplasmoidaceae bacterium]
MQKEKLHINAVKTDDETIQPSGTSPDDKVVYQKQTTDPETKARRKRSIIKWVIALLLIGLFIFLIVWGCTPRYRSVNVKNASVDSETGRLELDTNGDSKADYKVNLKNSNDSWAFYYVTGQTNVYSIHADPVGGGKEIEFKMERVWQNDSFHFYIGGVEVSDTTGTTFADWAQTITANASVETGGTNIGIVLLNMLPTIIFLVVIIWYFSKVTKMSGMMGQGEDSIFGMGKSSAKIAKSNVKFSDVAGIEEEKNELIEIVDYLKNPEKYAAMGARTPRGVILYGPPGTGKTLLAKAVAGEASVPFFQASGSSFDDMLVGVGAKRVRDLFLRAKKAAPSIIFIDEIDSVAGKRGRNDIAGGSGGIADQTINQLLAEMDGFNTRTGVVIMAATNRLDSLDEAILRPGRFDRHIQVNLPDIKEREAILKIHARNKNLSSKVSLADVARRTPGFSGAQLENVLNEATLLAVRLGKTAISMSEIDEAIDRVIAGPAKKSRVITEEEKKQIAYHEAGHALVGLHTKGGDVVEKITIIPRGVAAGYTLSTPEKQELAIHKKSDLLAIVRTTLGGRAAEEVIYGKDSISTGASNDLYKVTNIVKSMVTQLGMSSVGMTQFIPTEGSVPAYAPKSFSEATNQKIDKEIEEIIQSEYAKAKDVIKHNGKELDLIVETLLLLETIVKNQIDYIHKELKLPPEAIEKKKALEEEKKEKAEAKKPSKAK